MKARSIPMYQISEELGMERSRGRKYAVTQGFTFHKKVDPSARGQKVNCLYDYEAEELKKIRRESLL